MMAAASPNRTPEGSPTRRKATITHAQKQALMDNLQLEITERARKLRAQYALMAQGLRSRLEMRVNRIPQSLRGINIEELINKTAEQAAAPKSLAAAGAKHTRNAEGKHADMRKEAMKAAARSPERPRSRKRPSAEMANSSDKENTEVNLDLPKKRAKTAMKPPPRSTRNASRQDKTAKVLSPKSNNTRSPQKTATLFSKQASPGKPASSVLAATATLANMTADASKGPSRNASRQVQGGPSAALTASTATGRGRRAAAQPAQRTQPRDESNSSNATNVSNGTTIVYKKAPPPAKRGIRGKVADFTAAAGRKAAGTKKENVKPASTSTGGRVLRARK